MHTVYFICVIASIITVVFMHLFEEEDIFFCIYMSVIVRLKKVNSLNVLLSFVIIIFTYWQSLFNMTCFFLTASMGVSEGKSVGSWFGPNTVAQVLK